MEPGRPSPFRNGSPGLAHFLPGIGSHGRGFLFALAVHSRKGAVDAGLAELGPTYDLRNREPICPQFFDLLHNIGGQDRLRTKPHPPGLGLVDAVLLALSADVILELGNQREDTHDQLAGARACVDAWVIEHFESYTSRGKLRDNAVEVRR